MTNRTAALPATKRPDRSLEYIGNKNRMLGFVVDPIAAVAPPGSAVADLFCGTGSVSGELKRRGYRVIAGDQLELAATVTRAVLFNSQEPRFEGLKMFGARQSHFPTVYEDVVGYLNSLPLYEGFVYRHYSPATAQHSRHTRMYFTRENAARIDAVRRQIRDWAPDLTVAEQSLLLSDLVKAASAVSNVAGTFGSYLKRWKRRALEELELVPAFFVDDGGEVGHEVQRGDAVSIASGLNVDVVYADPPYTKRQYAAYYHVLETIVRDDAPELTGSTGLRPWARHASDWSYKRRAPAALQRLLFELKASFFFLSYSSDGHIPHSQILEILGSHGPTRCWELESRRYRSSRLEQSSQTVVDRLYQVELLK